MPALLSVLGARYMQGRDEPINFRGRLGCLPKKFWHFGMEACAFVHMASNNNLYKVFSYDEIIKMLEVCLNDPTSNKVIVTNHI